MLVHPSRKPTAIEAKGYDPFNYTLNLFLQFTLEAKSQKNQIAWTFKGVIHIVCLKKTL